MNSRQRRVLVISLCLFVTSVFLPPWRLRVDGSPYYGSVNRVSYSPLWRTPHIIPKGERYKVYLTVDIKLLAAEWLGIAVVASGLMIILRKSRRKPSGRTIREDECMG